MSETIMDEFTRLRDALSVKKQQIDKTIDALDNVIQKLPRSFSVDLGETATRKNFQRLFYQAKIIEAFVKARERGVASFNWDQLFLQSGAKLIRMNPNTFRGYLFDLVQKGFVVEARKKSRWQLTEQGLACAKSK